MGGFVELQGLEMKYWTICAHSETFSVVQSKHDWTIEILSRQNHSTPRGGCRVGDSWGSSG
jgi:hypothetical protein